MNKCKWVTVLFTALALVACSKVNLLNYEKLEMGMSQQSIEEILGSATNCSESVGTKRCLWGDEEGKHIKINFALDKAVMFSNKGLE